MFVVDGLTYISVANEQNNVQCNQTIKMTNSARSFCHPLIRMLDLLMPALTVNYPSFA